MTSDTQDAVSCLKARIAALAPLVAEQREAMERERRLTRPVFQAIAEAGLLRLWAPRALGGWELSPPEFMAVVEAAATLDGSIGWVVGNGGGMSRAAGYLPEAVARRWFARDDALVVATNGAIGEAVSVEGGYRISGRWPFASGIHHASLVAAACRVADGSWQGPVLLCYVPAEHAKIVDNWRVSGLRASGSCDYTLSNVFVPVEHTHDMLNPPATQPGLPYRWPAISAFATTVSVVPLGIARAALDSFTGGLAARTRAGTSVALRDRELIQSEVGRAEVLHAAARALLLSAMNDGVRRRRRRFDLGRTLARAAGPRHPCRSQAHRHVAEQLCRVGSDLSRTGTRHPSLLKSRPKGFDGPVRVSGQRAAFGASARPLRRQSGPLQSNRVSTHTSGHARCRAAHLLGLHRQAMPVTVNRPGLDGRPWVISATGRGAAMSRRQLGPTVGVRVRVIRHLPRLGRPLCLVRAKLRSLILTQSEFGPLGVPAIWVGPTPIDWGGA